MENVCWRYVTISPLKFLFAWFICYMIAAIIWDKITKGKVWTRMSQFDVIVISVLSVVLVLGVNKVTSALSSNGMSCTDKIVSDWYYIPEVNQLCDKDGNRRYSSYDEYREEFYAEHAEPERDPCIHTDEELANIAADYYESIHGSRPVRAYVKAVDRTTVKISLLDMINGYEAFRENYFVDQNTLHGTDHDGNEVQLR